MKRIILILLVICLHYESAKSQDDPMIIIKKIQEIRVEDKANNLTYRCIELGDQIWTIPSIKNKKYNDGTKIKRIYGDHEWNTVKTGAYRITDSKEKFSYGYIYNGYAIETNKLCPEGWRAATINDYIKLATYLQSDSAASVRYSHIIDTNKYSITEARQVRCLKEK